MNITMKDKYLIIFAGLILIIFSGCKTEDQRQDEINTDIIKNPVTLSGSTGKSVMPVISFVKTNHDFGLLIEGEKVEYSFKFTNTGESDLVIAKVSADCGCTVPTFVKKPVKSGEEGEITVSFNTENRYGVQNKTIKVLSNAQPSLNELTITADIIRP